VGYPQDPRYQGQPPAGQPAYPYWPNQPGMYPPPAPTNGTAIAALIFAILFAPIGIILGYVARSQIKRTGEGGRGLATAALIIGYVFVAIPLVTCLVIAVLIVADNSHNNHRQQSPVPTVTDTGTPP
jgi:Domain of unknown function (DUF4190)